MSLASLLALILGLSLTTYALLAGADFGAGILDLLAGRSDAERAAIEREIGPLWEANHVWLIFSLTILFSAFPAAFSALGTALLAPLIVALLAIVLRGAALGLRSSQARADRSHLLLSRLLGATSLIAPVAFGLVAGGLAQASRSAGTRPHAVPPIPWAHPFAIVAGLLAACLCAQLAASFLAVRMARADRLDLAEGFRRRGLQSGAGLLVLSLLGLIVTNQSSARLYGRLTDAALPLVILALAGMATSLLALQRRRYPLARAATLVAAAALVWGWLVAQSPALVGPCLTIHSAAATAPALTAIAIACGVVLVAVIPALFFLFTLFARPLPSAEVST